jgi:hypothetical protein
MWNLNHGQHVEAYPNSKPNNDTRTNKKRPGLITFKLMKPDDHNIQMHIYKFDPDKSRTIYILI